MTIFEDVKKLNLPEGEYAVVGSGVLSAHGIRQHQDVDLIVTSKLFDTLKSEGWEDVPGKHAVIKKGMYEADADFKYKEYQPNHTQLIQQAELIEGVPFIRLDELVKFKRALGRDKDKRDIELVERYLG
jgi:hypothetical protein